MKEKNAKVGLRVQMKSKDSKVPCGTLGTITEVLDDTVWVHWDDYVGGWDDAAKHIPDGHGWAVGVEDVRKVKETPQ